MGLWGRQNNEAANMQRNARKAVASNLHQADRNLEIHENQVFVNGDYHVATI